MKPLKEIKLSALKDHRKFRRSRRTDYAVWVLQRKEKKYAICTSYGGKTIYLPLTTKVFI